MPFIGHAQELEEHIYGRLNALMQNHPRARRVMHYTSLRRDGNSDYVLRYYDTDIIKVTPDGVEFNPEEHVNQSSQRRMNWFLEKMGLPLYLKKRDGSYVFYNTETGERVNELSFSNRIARSYEELRRNLTPQERVIRTTPIQRIEQASRQHQHRVRTERAHQTSDETISRMIARNNRRAFERYRIARELHEEAARMINSRARTIRTNTRNPVPDITEQRERLRIQNTRRSTAPEDDARFTTPQVLREELLNIISANPNHPPTTMYLEESITLPYRNTLTFNNALRELVSANLISYNSETGRWELTIQGRNSHQLMEERERMNEVRNQRDAVRNNPIRNPNPEEIPSTTPLQRAIPPPLPPPVSPPRLGIRARRLSLGRGSAILYLLSMTNHSNSMELRTAYQERTHVSPRRTTFNNLLREMTSAGLLELNLGNNTYSITELGRAALEQTGIRTRATRQLYSENSSRQANTATTRRPRAPRRNIGLEQELEEIQSEIEYQPEQVPEEERRNNPFFA